MIRFLFLSFNRHQTKGLSLPGCGTRRYPFSSFHASEKLVRICSNQGGLSGFPCRGVFGEPSRSPTVEPTTPTLHPGAMRSAKWRPLGPRPGSCGTGSVHPEICCAFESAAVYAAVYAAVFVSMCRFSHLSFQTCGKHELHANKPART